MYKTIIMPVDVFEMELSDKAVRHAEFLAQQDGVIHLLHVLPGSSSFTMSRFTADLRRFEEHLRDMVNELANEIKADVVVIGSRNPSISTHLLGSNASSVIRHAHIPVMVVR